MMNRMKGLCECGCGGKAPIAKANNAGRGHVKGKPVRFIQGHATTRKHAAPHGTKWCTGCERFLPTSDFYKTSKGDGFVAKCKPCWTVACRISVLQRKYGLSKEDLERMTKAQKGRCAICKRRPQGEALHVDHCHDTGKVRGLLCGQCNRAIGLFQHKTKRLTAAIAYLA